MKRHAFYPTVFPTVRSRRSTVLRFLVWLLAFSAVATMVVSTALFIAYLNARDAQLDSAYMQGVSDGVKLFCRKGT